MKKQPPLGMSVGAGLGVGLLGAVALALRFRWKNRRTGHIPDAISPAVFATRFLNTTAGEIVYHTSGTGDPLIFLHAVFPGASSFEWSKIYPHFAPTHHVLVPDLIGFGESQRPRPALSAQAQVHSLTEFIDATTHEPVTLIASGLNANIALLLAARYPKKIARLLLWMPLLALSRDAFRSTHRWLSWFPSLARTAYLRQLSTVPFIKNWLLRSGFTENDPSFEEALTVFVSTAQQCGAEHAFLAQSSPRFWRAVRSLFSTITIPTTLLIGHGSERLTAEAINILRPLTSRFSIVELETNNSLAQLTEPGVMIAAIERELSES